MASLRIVAAAITALGIAVSGAAAQEQKKPDAKQDRAAAIARAKVWMPTTIASMDVKAGPQGPGAFAPGATITCDYLDKKMSGASPKFACKTAAGEELKVKYGGSNGEVYGEVAATRLLWALGFGADDMYSVKVICRGCPEDVGGIARDNGERILDPATVERKMPGRELMDAWKWRELDGIDDAAGGASKAERDALKLLAVMLQHSDSKPQQQRLICMNESEDAAGPCDMPVMMINDLGVTFGRANMFNQQPGASVHLMRWRETPIWRGETGCIGNLEGSFTGTLKHPLISEDGRAFLAGLLNQLSDEQIVDLFAAARIHLRPRDPESGRSGFATAEEWAAAFKQKRSEISERKCQA